MSRALLFPSPAAGASSAPARSTFGPGFGGGSAVAVGEVTVAGLSTDPGQVLGTGGDGGVLLVGADIAGALDALLGGVGWRQSVPEPVLGYDAASRAVTIAGGTGVVLPVATSTAAGLVSADDKARLDAMETGATADQTAPEIAALLAADASSAAALATALGVPVTPADIGAAEAGHVHTVADLTDFPALGEAAALDAGTAPGELVALDGNGRLPAVDGSQLLNLPGGGAVESVNGLTGAVTLDAVAVGAAAAAHGHVVADISDFPALGSAAVRDVPAAGDATAGEVVTGDDSRLSDARAPLAHGHLLADISDAGSAAAADLGDFATAAQGALAETAVQPGDGALAPDPVSSVAGDLVLAPSDARRFVKLTSGLAQTVTVEAASLPADGYVTLVKTGSGAANIVAGAGASLINATTGTLTGLGQYAAVSIKATDVAGEYVVIGAGG